MPSGYKGPANDAGNLRDSIPGICVAVNARTRTPGSSGSGGTRGGGPSREKGGCGGENKGPANDGGTGGAWTREIGGGVTPRPRPPGSPLTGRGKLKTPRPAAPMIRTFFGSAIEG